LTKVTSLRKHKVNDSFVSAHQTVIISLSGDCQRLGLFRSLDKKTLCLVVCSVNWWTINRFIGRFVMRGFQSKLMITSSVLLSR